MCHTFSQIEPFLFQVKNGGSRSRLGGSDSVISLWAQGMSFSVNECAAKLYKTHAGDKQIAFIVHQQDGPRMKGITNIALLACCYLSEEGVLLTQSLCFAKPCS